MLKLNKKIIQLNLLTAVLFASFGYLNATGYCANIEGPLTCPKLVLFSQAENTARHLSGEMAYFARQPDRFGYFQEPSWYLDTDLALEYQHSYDRGDIFDVDISNVILEPYFYAEFGWKDQSRSHWGKGGVIWMDFTIPFVHTSLGLETTVTSTMGGAHEFCCFKANGVADLPFQLGYTFLRGHKGELCAFARMVAPTGKLAYNCPFTESLIGYDRWQFGGGMWGHMRVYEKNAGEAAVTFWGSFYATHLFNKKVETYTYFPIDGDIGNFIPHKHVTSKIHWQLNAVLCADLMYRHWNWTLGYEFKGRDREKYECGYTCDAPQIFANKAWGYLSYYWDICFPTTLGLGAEIDIGQGRNIPNFWGVWFKATARF